MIGYMGGKSGMSEWIIDHFPDKYEDMLYVEVFGGGGWVLGKKRPSFMEVYNDIDQHIVTLMQVIRDNHQKFIELLENTPVSRTEFEKAKKRIKERAYSDPIDWALDYAMLLTQSHSCNLVAFAINTQSNQAVSKLKRFTKRVLSVHQRLLNVIIENLDFRKLIEHYDGKNTFFYLDPPYYGHEEYYNIHDKDNRFKKQDHIDLSNILKDIQGKFVLSYQPHDDIVQMYRNEKFIFDQKEIFLLSELVKEGKERKKSTELIVSNFKKEAVQINLF